MCAGRGCDADTVPALVRSVDTHTRYCSPLSRAAWTRYCSPLLPARMERGRQEERRASARHSPRSSSRGVPRAAGGKRMFWQTSVPNVFDILYFVVYISCAYTVCSSRTVLSISPYVHVWRIQFTKETAWRASTIIKTVSKQGLLMQRETAAIRFYYYTFCALSYESVVYISLCMNKC